MSIFPCQYYFFRHINTRVSVYWEHTIISIITTCAQPIFKLNTFSFPEFAQVRACAISGMLRKVWTVRLSLNVNRTNILFYIWCVPFFMLLEPPALEEPSGQCVICRIKLMHVEIRKCGEYNSETMSDIPVVGLWRVRCMESLPLSWYSCFERCGAVVWWWPPHHTNKHNVHDTTHTHSLTCTSYNT